MKNPLVSVIVPAFNAGSSIIETLESVKKQTFSNWECIVVNDGSTDDTKNKVINFIRDDSRFKLININNSGVSKARNLAVSHSIGFYLLPLDSDNYINEDYLNRCLSIFKNQSYVKLVYTETILFGLQNRFWNLPPFNYKNLLKYNMIDNSSLFLREEFNRVGGYRTNMKYGFEDWDFFIALLYGCKDHEVVKINEPLLHYRTSNSGRGSRVVMNGYQNEMLDNIVYNNYFIYKEYFPEIFKRIHEYDFHKTMMEKMPVKRIVKLLILISKLKNTLKKSKSG